MPPKQKLMSYILLCYLVAALSGLSQGLPQAGTNFEDLLKNMTDAQAKTSDKATGSGNTGIYTLYLLSILIVPLCGPVP